MPDDFVAAWVLRCREEVREVPGDGSWNVLVAERADTSAADLVDLLRGPSDSLADGPCRTIGIIPPYFLLVDDEGRALLPALPTDGCGLPREEVLDLVDTLPYRTISEERLSRTQSRTSAETGCPDSWKDTIAIDADQAQPAPARELWPVRTESLRVCVYGDITAGEIPTGELESGHVTQARPLRDALEDAGPALPCATAHTRFAVLTTEPEGGWATVELDGCRRLQRPDNTLGQLDQHTTDLIPVM